MNVSRVLINIINLLKKLKIIKKNKTKKWIHKKTLLLLKPGTQYILLILIQIKAPHKVIKIQFNYYRKKSK